METEDKAENLTPRQVNRRKAPRYGVEEEATLLLVNHGSRLPCRVVDLSLNGCRLRTKDLFRAGSLVRVEVNFKVRGLAFRLGGVTQWTDGRHLVGVRFVDVIERRKVELAEALGEIEKAIADKAQEQTAVEPAVDGHDSTKEGNRAPLSIPAQGSGAASLPTPRTLPASPVILAPGTARTVDSGANAPRIGSVPASDESSERPFLVPQTPSKQAAPPTAAPRNRDRREQSRQEVDTTAVIFLVNIASRLKGRILDLSLSGCRIRTDERFPVGIYTRVETEFHLEGLPFRLGGVIQALHDRHHVGIRFLDMSPRKREQIEQLMAEIAALRAELEPGTRD